MKIKQVNDTLDSLKGTHIVIENDKPVGDRPWRKHAPPINKAPSNPDYPTKPFDRDEWMKSSKPMEEDSERVPEVGDNIRTKKTQMQGVVERVGINPAGYEEVFFRIADGRLMKTPVDNIIVVEKIADEEAELMELSNELLGKYKKAAGADASAADKGGNAQKGNKRFSGIVKATNKQFSNDAKKREAKEGMMGGINRSRPAVDVSYEKVLDDDILDEVYNKWKEASSITENTDEKVAKMKEWALANYENGGDTFVETYSDEDLALLLDEHHGDVDAAIEFMSRLADVWSERQADARYHASGGMEESVKDDFADILAKQHAETQATTKKLPTKDIPYHGYTIRYRQAATAGEKVQWMILDKKHEIKKRGESMSDKDAVADAEDWIKSGGEQLSQAADRVTIDFNVNFAKEFAPDGDTFFGKIEKVGKGPALILSTVHQDGFKKSHIRTQKNKITGTTTKLPMIPMSAAESNAAGLEPNGRYLLGDKVQQDDNTAVFPLIFQGKTQSKTDAVRMGKPGITVATSRDVDEAITPWGGYTPDDKKANALTKAPKSTMQGSKDVPFDQMVKDSIKAHGIRWAFDYYVRKNGLPPRQFQIFAGLAPDLKPKGTDPAPQKAKTPDSKAAKPEKKGWWKSLRDKLPFEE